MRLPEKPPFLKAQEPFIGLSNEIEKAGKLQELLDTNDNKYPFWETWKYLAREWGIPEKKVWAVVKASRAVNRQIKITSDPGFSFSLGTPSIVLQFLHEFDLNLGGSLQGEGIIPSENRDRYLISSLMEEAIASSQLEGAATTRKMAKEMLQEDRKPRNESEQMILNNYEGMKWIVENRQLPFTQANIRQLHSIITKNTLSQTSEEGAYRTDNQVKVVDVQTGHTVYTPPSHERLEELMEQFCKFANEITQPSFFIHPILKGIFLHFLVGYIHPFSDGNGRTARTIFYWFLLKKGYWLIEYMSVSRIILASKAQYARAYLHTEMDNNDLTYFLIYHLKCIQTALEDLKKYVHRKTTEKKSMLKLLRHTSFNDRQIAVLQDITQDNNLYFSVQQIQNRFGVSNQTARNDLTDLVTAGLMEFRKNGKRIDFFPVKDFTARISRNEK